jgi:hypothetical protein
MTKIRFAAVVLFLLVFAAGCRSGAKPVNNPGAGQTGQSQSALKEQRPITAPDTFLTLYKQWDGSLASLAGEIDDSYNKWSSNQISRQEFLAQLYATQQKLEILKMDADYQNFELSANDQQTINSQAINRAYFTAEKDVNDFLYYAPHLQDEKIKARYNDLILNQYTSNNKELQALLGKQ